MGKIDRSIFRHDKDFSARHIVPYITDVTREVQNDEAICLNPPLVWINPFVNSLILPILFLYESRLYDKRLVIFYVFSSIFCLGFRIVYDRFLRDRPA